MDSDPHCGFRSCKNFKIESDRCYLHIGFEDSNCYDCDKRLSSVDYFCSFCAKIRMERYCKNCSKYSEFRHTEDTSITFGVRGGSARWAETTYAYAPPVCVTCGKNRNFHWADDWVAPVIKMTIFLSICWFLIVESPAAAFLTCLGIAFGFPLLFLLVVELRDRYDKIQPESEPDANSLQAHRLGQFLSQEQKELVHARTEKKIDQLVEDKLRSRPANVPPVQQKAQGTQQQNSTAPPPPAQIPVTAP